MVDVYPLQSLANKNNVNILWVKTNEIQKHLIGRVAMSHMNSNLFNILVCDSWSIAQVKVRASCSYALDSNATCRLGS